MAALLSHAGPRPSTGVRPLSRTSDQAVARDPATGCRRRQVFGQPGQPVDIQRLELPAGGRAEAPATASGHDRRLVWVQAGDLVVRADGERHELLAGDCLALGAPCAATFANEGLLPCTFAVVSVRA